MASQIRIGSNFKEYKIKKRLGSGSFGQVFRAIDQKDGEEKALKFVNKDDRSGKKEIEILKLLENVRGVPVLEDSFTIGRWTILVLPIYLGDMESLKLDQFEPKTTMKVAIETLKILQNLHAEGVIHRDLKLGNLMIPYESRGATLVIIDLGMATVFKEKNPNNNRRSRVPTIQGDYRFIDCPYSSRRLCQGFQASEADDCEMLSYLLLDCRDIFTFHGTGEEMLAQKNEFCERPRDFLPQSSMFLEPIIQDLCGVVPGKTPKYSTILREMRRNGYAINESTPFTIRTAQDGKPFIK
ncbi:hypothetical protein CAEBREN_17408 [Caenorhabditis brenneri]|uniref:non-specific serine/threonine protein kinase n=1 Tax=Caenorhabditis brenneri TaxID=135651 RepID=G0MH87_CAEBE|nr:hypothetical protein CAEBREN_17408 [Caenorhabditis brenneri]